MATMTESLAYRHRIASLCSRETGKKEKFPGSEARNLASAVEASGEEAGKTWYPGGASFAGSGFGGTGRP
jgi:hypothetical protein